MIVAITAPKGNGKDLTADYIVNKYGYQKIAYADHLKEILRLVFNFSDQELHGTQEDKERINEEYGISSRQAALAFGDFMRYTLPSNFDKYKEKMGVNYFVNYVMKTIEKTNKNYVISDIRFNNEITELRKKFPNKKILLIRLNRNTQGFNEITDKHHSENPNNINSEEIDVIIENNGSIEELYSKIDIIISNLHR